MSSLPFCLFLFFIPFFCSSSTRPIHDDRISLLEFKSLIANDPQQYMADWNPANPLWNWTGITCTRRHQMDRVIALNLTAMDLQGSISPSLGNLSFLHSIDLSNNALHGNIPPQLGRLFRLRELWLYSNQLEGSIPGNLSSCHNLVELNLSFNNLTANIPPELGSLSHLQQLILEANDLTGRFGQINCPSHDHFVFSLRTLGGSVFGLTTNNKRARIISDDILLKQASQSSFILSSSGPSEPVLYAFLIASEADPWMIHKLQTLLLQASFSFSLMSEHLCSFSGSWWPLYFRVPV